MSKNHIAVTSKIRRDVVTELETVARKMGTTRSGLIRMCVLDFLAAQPDGDFPAFIPSNKISSVA